MLQTIPRPATTAAARHLIDDPARSDALIAAEAGCSAPTVYRARALCESMGLIQHVPRQHRADRRGDRHRPLHDAAAATDVLTVSKPARSAYRPPPRPYIPDLPPPPDFSRGWCTRVPPENRGWWTSRDPAERLAARRYCASCPVREPCEAWALSLSPEDPAVYGGMTQVERVRRKRELRVARPV